MHTSADMRRSSANDGVCGQTLTQSHYVSVDGQLRSHWRNAPAANVPGVVSTRTKQKTAEPVVRFML